MRTRSVGRPAAVLSVLASACFALPILAQGRPRAPVIGPGLAVEQAPSATADIMVPILIQEALAEGVGGVDRLGHVASFGLPFSAGMRVQQIKGRPALGVEGSDLWQFRTLDTWPDGSVRWALLDVDADVPAGDAAALTIVRGGGATPGRPKPRHGG